jgi:hypothetical protein
MSLLKMGAQRVEVHKDLGRKKNLQKTNKRLILGYITLLNHLGPTFQ